MMQIVVIEQNNSATGERTRERMLASWPAIVANKRPDESGLFDIAAKAQPGVTAAGVIIRLPPPALAGTPMLPVIGDVVQLGPGIAVRILARAFSMEQVDYLAEEIGGCLEKMGQEGQRRIIVPPNGAQLAQGLVKP